MKYWLLVLAIFVGETDKPPVDFDTEIVPVLTRYGCNAGACHGAAAGRGGLKLSLFGSRPEQDHEAIVRQFLGRRVNLAMPDRSLILLKPTGEMEHGGDLRFDLDSAAGQQMLNWIRQGADRNQMRKLVRFYVEPSSRVVEAGQSVRLRAMAEFDDQTKQDVSAWTVFESEDNQTLQVDESKLIAHPVTHGRHILTARYLDQVVAVEFLVPFLNADIDANQLPRVNFVDEHINEKLSKLRIPVSRQTTDAEFVRRLYLDLTGQLPSPKKIIEFHIDDSNDKRERLIGQLMTSDAFTDYWTYRFGQWLRLGAKQQDGTSSQAYYQWLRKQVGNARPIDQVVQELLNASGDTYKNGAANFYRTADNPRLQAEFVSQALMGVQLRCANCHDHPLDRWTQDDYHGLAAVFAKIQTGKHISVNATGDVVNPRTGEPALAKLPGTLHKTDQVVDRDQFTRWLTSAENPHFSTAVTNRIWANFFGRGLVDPIDDIRTTNPATHPELLRQLAEDFQSNGYEFRSTIQLICNSAAYQRSCKSTQGNEADDRFYSRMSIRKLDSEVLADAIANVTGVYEPYPKHDEGTRAIQLFKPGVKNELLEVLGRCSDAKICEAGGTAAGGIAQQLQLINGKVLNQRISQSTSRLRTLFQSNRSDEDVVSELYLRSLARRPTETESEFWKTQLLNQKPESRLEILEDLTWGLLTCREFVTNH